MRLVTWNVNSLKQRMPRVLELLERHRPEVVCLQETKCASEGFPHLELQAAGYTAVDHSGGRWAGVAILARDHLDVTDVRVGLPGAPLAEEARWVEAVVAGVRVASVYVVNGRSLADPVFAAKLAMLEAMRAHLAVWDGPALVAGDFNIAPRDVDVWDPSRFVGTTHTSPDERTRLRDLLDAGYVDAFVEARATGDHRFTWWDYRAGAFHRNLGMRIDLILASRDLTPHLAWCGIDREFRKGAKPSDHAPLLLDIDRP